MSVGSSELLSDTLCLLSVVYMKQSPLDISVLHRGISEVLLTVRLRWLVPSPAILKQQCGNKSCVEYVEGLKKASCNGKISSRFILKQLPSFGKLFELTLFPIAIHLGHWKNMCLRGMHEVGKPGYIILRACQAMTAF